jgi:hypothetical protein
MQGHIPMLIVGTPILIRIHVQDHRGLSIHDPLPFFMLVYDVINKTHTFGIAGPQRHNQIARLLTGTVNLDRTEGLSGSIVHKSPCLQ